MITQLGGQRNLSMNIPTIQTEERPSTLTQRTSGEKSGSPLKRKKKKLVINLNPAI